MSVALIVIIALVVIVGLGVVVSYNRFVRQRNLVQESWRQIDVELNRRHDLIPNLVETVKGYAAHERGTFEAVTQARNAAAAPGATPAEQAAQENILTGALRQLFAVAEAYPQLRASEQFTQLQASLNETEDRIAAGRRFYNGNVRALNTRVESFPSSIIAGAFHFQKAEYFEVEDADVRAAPKVDFGQSVPQAAAPAAPASTPAATDPAAGSAPPSTPSA